LETIPEQWETMTTSLTDTIRERVRHIETMPAIPFSALRQVVEQR
jgi:hypothetical protein